MERIWLRRFWLCASTSLLMLVVACSGPLVRSTNKVTAENKGYLLLSMGPATDETYASMYNVVLRERSTGALTSIAFSTGEHPLWAPTQRDFSDKNGQGAVYLLELPSGEYEVANYRAAITAGNAATTPASALRFSVQKGQVAYLARFLVEVEWRTYYNALWSKTVRDGPKVATAVVTDAYDADVAIARAKYPGELSAMPAVLKQSARSPAI